MDLQTKFKRAVPPAAILTPGPVEIIRACQKDADFIGRLQEDINEAIEGFLAQRLGHEWGHSRKSAYISTAVYYALTNLAGLQTLGEEYAGIVQVNSSGREIPSKKALYSMVIFTTIGQPMLEYVMSMLEQYLSKKVLLKDCNNAGKRVRKLLPDKTCDSELDESYWAATAQETLRVIRHYLPWFCQLHLALFFFKGTFYHFSKRVTGIYYILIRRWFAVGEKSSRRNLKYLMWISIINCMLTIVKDSATFIKCNPKNLQKKPEQISASIGSCQVNEPGQDFQITELKSKCIICLDYRTGSSVTPCGHIFCWSCIIDCLRTKQECPICREEFETSRVVPLRNLP